MSTKVSATPDKWPLPVCCYSQLCIIYSSILDYTWMRKILVKRMQGSFRKFLYFSIALLLGIAALLYVEYNHQLEYLQQMRTATAEHAVSKSAAQISQEIALLQRSVRLFYFSSQEQIHQLLANPENDALHDEILAALKTSFPNAITYTLTDNRGTPLIVDFENYIGELCLENLKEVAAHSNTKLRVHPSAQGYHFDIMTPFPDMVDKGVFYISFKSYTLSRYLVAPPGHQLMLINTENPGLIELTVHGSRDQLQRDNFLSEKEMNSIAVSEVIPGSNWRLVDIINSRPGFSEHRNLLFRSVLIFLAFALASLVALLFIYFDDRKLTQAIHALEYHKINLEERIKLHTWELSEANRELQALSRQDCLTGLANRRFFDYQIELEVRRMQRDNKPLSLLMIDVDFFKNYNDSLGHPAGDSCLKQVAEVISEHTHRGGDLAARYGGEEFAVILAGTDDSAAIILAENLRLAVLARQLKHPDSRVSPYITVSIGVATLLPGSSCDAHELVEASDKALYTAKKAGRNRVEQVAFQAVQDRASIT